MAIIAKFWGENMKKKFEKCVKLMHGENAKFWVENMKEQIESILSNLCMVKMQSSEVMIWKNIESSVSNLCMVKCFSMVRAFNFNQHDILATSTQAIGFTTTHIDESLHREKWN